MFSFFLICKGQSYNISVPEFHENSFLELPLTANVGESLTLEVWFLATKPTGNSRECEIY